MTAVATILWFSVLLCDTVGQLSFKAAATVDSGAEGLQHWLVLMRNRWIWIGISVYFFEFFLWLAFLSMVPLSVAMLLSTVNIVTVMIGGRILFHETITKKRATAALLIAAGVALVGWN